MFALKRKYAHIPPSAQCCLDFPFVEMFTFPSRREFGLTTGLYTVQYQVCFWFLRTSI